MAAFHYSLLAVLAWTWAKEGRAGGKVSLATVAWLSHSLLLRHQLKKGNF
jgi:hypothetical protein